MSLYYVMLRSASGGTVAERCRLTAVMDRRYPADRSKRAAVLLIMTNNGFFAFPIADIMSSTFVTSTWIITYCVCKQLADFPRTPLLYISNSSSVNNPRDPVSLILSVVPYDQT